MSELLVLGFSIVDSRVVKIAMHFSPVVKGVFLLTSWVEPESNAACCYHSNQYSINYDAMKRFSLRLSEHEHKAITAYANFWELSLNDAIREAIRALVGNPRGIEPLDPNAILPHPADAEDGD